MAVGDTATSFPVLLGDLQESLANKRRLLASMAMIANDQGELVPHYSEHMTELAKMVVRLEELATILEDLIPHEAQVRALAADGSLLPGYVPIDPYCELTGLDALIQGVVEEECGFTAKVLFKWPGMGETRVRVARGEIVGVRRS